MFNLKKFLIMGIFCMMFFVATAHTHDERSKGVFKLKDLKGWFSVQGITAGFALRTGVIGPSVDSSFANEIKVFTIKRQRD